MKPECLITGCWLNVPLAGMCVWGDLHRAGGAWVFNATLDKRGGPHWQNAKPAPEAKALVVRSPHEWFERRGVVVLAPEAADLNDAAARYVEAGRRLG